MTTPNHAASDCPLLVGPLKPNLYSYKSSLETPRLVLVLRPSMSGGPSCRLESFETSSQETCCLLHEDAEEAFPSPASFFQYNPRT
ncbi:hypothetical protein COCC4DRAFT_72793 [Bipolaris maydis ATCC 48331]|uniref:Uncharacterized protein n=2 Tax=Cochliobolus heterostrophus TaxID=5016 RepID=M2VC33_COCH5|nr:uncharacterized protein COCC4DRAFT_72793 [Bipolaris maydis ATCC 48331]EMD97253.1 hypothetical protein COCHEDRAFT_1124521 [Bipolaris maydis C5]ENI04286.1 hypothetical protein COCC4DRAFT_72793 [Bipolaris maydis ATCC 48331]